MPTRSKPAEPPPEFLDAVERLRHARLRPEVSVQEIPAPGRIAPHSLAMAGDLVVQQEELASGRFVLLCDPDGQEAWEGTMRAVTFVRAAMEPDLAADPLLWRIGWTWWEEALTASGVSWRAAGGTVTRVVSESFGALADRPPTVELEIRVSWTPVDDVAGHLRAWSELLCTVGGLPPLPDGVAALPRRRV
ncbi:MAG: DUF3000 domain-containing protein [Kineosporiaceae bacterium]